jgi:ABC-type transport system substrate-binding protein
MLLTITADWQQIGMAITPYIIPRQQADDLEYRATYPAMELVRQNLDHVGTRNIHSRNTPLPDNGFRVTGNRSRYHNPELDALADRYLTTISLPERREVMGQVVRHISENLPFLMMLYTSSVYLVANRVQNFKSDGPWNSYEWDVRS